MARADGNHTKHGEYNRENMKVCQKNKKKLLMTEYVR